MNYQKFPATPDRHRDVLRLPAFRKVEWNEGQLSEANLDRQVGNRQMWRQGTPLFLPDITSRD